MDVAAWLRGLGLERYDQAFRDNEISRSLVDQRLNRQPVRLWCPAQGVVSLIPKFRWLQRQLKTSCRASACTLRQVGMELRDDDLTNFERHGAEPLRATNDQGYVDHEGARIWYATFGAGHCVIMLHGGLGHSGNWGYQVPGLMSSGYRVVLIDSRGHGHSTRDEQPYTYELMVSDVLAVMDHLSTGKSSLRGLERRRMHCIGPRQECRPAECRCLLLCMQHGSQRHKGYQAQPNPQPVFGPTYQRLCAVVGHAGPIRSLRRGGPPDAEDEPNYSLRDLAEVHVPIAIVQGENDEFIKLEHAEYLARSIPGAEFILLPEVSHFAPLQRPEKFNSVMLAFLGNLLF